jgi:hypothetical protein
MIVFGAPRLSVVDTLLAVCHRRGDRSQICPASTLASIRSVSWTLATFDFDANLYKYAIGDTPYDPEFRAWNAK